MTPTTVSFMEIVRRFTFKALPNVLQKFLMKNVPKEKNQKIIVDRTRLGGNIKKASSATGFFFK